MSSLLAADGCALKAQGIVHEKALSKKSSIIHSIIALKALRFQDALPLFRMRLSICGFWKKREQRAPVQSFTTLINALYACSSLTFGSLVRWSVAVEL